MYRATKGYQVLAPERLTLRKEPLRTEGLVLTLKGADPGGVEQQFTDVRVRRVFPLSESQVVAFCDRNGEEIGVLWDPSGLDPASRQVLEQELERAYFVPRITKIKSIKDDYGVSKWDVETDRGPRRFDVGSRYDIRILPGRRLLIRDLDGNRYEIPDFEMLDADSRDLLELEI